MIKIYKIIKKIFILVIILMLILVFHDSYTYFNIDNLAFVNAIGIDLADNNNYKISFQFTKPSTSTNASSSSENIPIINTVETYSISTAINLMNSYLGKELNLSHCKLIVFSEKVAVRGIADDIYTLVNNIQIRPSSNIVITKTDAKYYLENSKPSLENLFTTYYEIFPNSSEYTGYLSNITVGSFFDLLVSKTANPCAILGGSISTNENDLDIYAPSSPENSGNIKSNETSISGKRGSENIGLAVFKEDKLIGELTAIETVCYSILSDSVNGFLITIPNPENSEKYLDVYLLNDNKPKIKVNIINGTPYITIDCCFTGKLYSISQDSNYMDSNVLNNISEAVNSYIKTQLSSYLYKTSKEFESDINGLGKFALSSFTTTTEFDNYDWLSNYKNAFFNINVDSNMSSGFLLSDVH
mgnify:FL=1